MYTVFVSAFTNFPFQLPEEITKNENYQNVSKLYNDNFSSPQNNINISPTNNILNPFYKHVFILIIYYYF